MDKLALFGVFSEYFRYPCHLSLHIHIRLHNIEAASSQILTVSLNESKTSNRDIYLQLRPACFSHRTHRPQHLFTHSSNRCLLILTLLVPCFVTNNINKPTRCTFCMYLFYNPFATLHVSKDYFFHHQKFINSIYLRLCTHYANMPSCSVLVLEFVSVQLIGLFIELFFVQIRRFTTSGHLMYDAVILSYIPPP